MLLLFTKRQTWLPRLLRTILRKGEVTTLSQFASSAHDLTLRLTISTSPLSGPRNICLALGTFLRSSNDSISFSVRNSKTSFAAFLNSITFLISTQFHFHRSSGRFRVKQEGTWGVNQCRHQNHPRCSLYRTPKASSPEELWFPLLPACSRTSTSIIPSGRSFKP